MFGKQLTKLLEQTGITREELAMIFHITVHRILLYELDLCNPTKDEIALMRNIFSNATLNSKIENAPVVSDETELELLTIFRLLNNFEKGTIIERAYDLLQSRQEHIYILAQLPTLYKDITIMLS